MRQGSWIVFLVTACSFDTSFPLSSGSSATAGEGSGAESGDGAADTTGGPEPGGVDDAATGPGESGGKADEGAMTSGALTTGAPTGGDEDGGGTSTSGAETGSGDDASSTGGDEASWAERRRLRVVDEAHDGVLDDVPILVVFDDTRIDYTLTSAGGADLRFRTSDDVVLSHEVEQWNPGGRSFVWVRVPSIVDGTAEFWMYYGNPEAQSVEDAPAVWSNGYVGVWHFAEHAEVGPPTLHDSTGNGHDGHLQGNVEAVEGDWGPGMRFQGAGDRAVVEHADAFDLDERLTVEGWFRSESVDMEEQRFILIKDHAYLLHATSVWTLQPYFYLRISEGWWGRSLGYELDTAAHYLAGSYDRNEALIRVYDQGRRIVDRDLVEDVGTAPVERSNADLELGRDVDGALFEVRVSDRVRSDDWIRVQSRSMNDELVDYGPAEPGDWLSGPTPPR